jgi:hypothetical protein
MKRFGTPLTRENYRFFSWFGTPPDYISAEEQAEIDDALEGETVVEEDVSNSKNKAE